MLTAHRSLRLKCLAFEAFRLQPPDRPQGRFLTLLFSAVDFPALRGSGLHLSVAGSPNDPAEASSLYYGLLLHLPLLPTSPRSDAVTVSYRPIGFAWMGLSPFQPDTLTDARPRASRPLMNHEHERGRVEDGRGVDGEVAPSPVPAHQTGRADFPHPAFRQASLSGPQRHAAFASSTASSEVFGYSWCCQALRQSPLLDSFISTPEARTLPSPGITRLHRYYGPLRLPPAPSTRHR